MKETCGQPLLLLSENVNPTLLLGSKLKQRLDTIGTRGCVKTSCIRGTESSGLYYQLTSSEVPTFGSDSTGSHTERKLWRTPTCSDAQGGCRWAIPRGALQKFKGTVKNQYLAAAHFGRTENGLRVQKGKALFFNPEVSRWLMGFPTSWSSVLDTEMQSSRNSERCSC